MRVFVLVLLAMLSSGAAAEWVAFGESGSGDTYFDIYVDPATIRRSGNMVKMWNMHDYKTARVIGGKAHLSVKMQTEYDCEVERVQILYLIHYSGTLNGLRRKDYKFREFRA